MNGKIHHTEEGIVIIVCQNMDGERYLKYNNHGLIWI